MRVGYARTSTLEQVAGLEAQRRELEQAGCEKLYEEQVGATAPRKRLHDALEFTREGDTLVVTKLDRLARSVTDLGRIVEHLERHGVALHILNLSLDTNNATGRLMINVVGSVAQFEREMMLERQREGIAKAKAEGKYRGRKPTARNRAEDIRKLAQTGVTRAEIAKQVGVSERSVYRVLSSA